MTYQVSLTEDAATDLADLFDYIASNDSDEKALYVLDKIEQQLGSLSEQLTRGVYPRELAALGIKEYREVFFKPYRIIYRVIGKRIYVYLIVDGRRDMQTLLARRLLSD